MDEELRRLRWRSRRGLLELDLVFDRFWAGAGAGITREDAAALERLLRLPDNDLLDLVMGRGPRLPPGAMVATLAAGALWCLASSLWGGGIVGAFLGAIVGTFFPVRRGSR